MTKQRELILNIINESPTHMNASEIFEKAKEIMPGVVFATVYNNLNYLVEHNIIMRIKRPGEPDYFDKNTMEHEHVRCDICGCLEDVNIPNIKSYLEELSGLELTGYNLSMHYICNSCKNKMR